MGDQAVIWDRPTKQTHATIEGAAVGFAPMGGRWR